MAQRLAPILLLLAACSAGGVCAGCDGGGAAEPPDAFTARTNDGSPSCPRSFPILDANGTPHMFAPPDDAPCARSDDGEGWTFVCPQPASVGGTVTIRLNDDLESGSVIVAYESPALTDCNRTAPIDEVVID